MTPKSAARHVVGKIDLNFVNLVYQSKPSSVFIIADHNTLRHCVPIIKELLPDAKVLVCPAGEKSKDLNTCADFWSRLITAGANRQSLVLNVGGGMVCDLGGFVASCYQRGIHFANIPTSLLAMTDAAIGGKNGIDHEGYKNYIGTIRFPEFVWIDDSFLQTLPSNEFINGASEIVKHAIIASPYLWTKLQDAGSIEQLNWRDILAINHEIKMKIVEADPFEMGIRKVLNFGHTIGHALESYFLRTDAPLSHGQCVALGMLAETKISIAMGLLNLQDGEDIIGLIHKLLVPVQLSLPTFAQLDPWIKKDKKSSGGFIGFSLPDSIGSCKWDIRVDDTHIASGLAWLAHGMGY